MSLIGHASKDENGTYKNGKAGDQTKAEVYTRTWYNRPWDYVIRANDDETREKIAQCMEKACANDHIGYDQNQRNSLLTQARKVGYDPSQVTADCETDCSALVSLCCMYAGIDESVLYVNNNSSTTSTLRKRLESTGQFEILDTKKYTSQSRYLMRGDILLYEGHHTAVNLENGSSVVVKKTWDGGFPKMTAREYYKVGDGIYQYETDGWKQQIKYIQEFLNWYLDLSLTVDGKYGQKTADAVKLFQTSVGITADGLYGYDTLAKAKVVTK